MKKALLLVLTLVLVLSLAACGGNDTNPPEETGSGGYPDYWDDDIPKMDGTVDVPMQLGNYVHVIVKVKNKSVIDNYIKSLENEGYEITKDQSGDTHRDVSLQNGEWIILINYNHAGGDGDIEVNLKYGPNV